MGCLLYCPQSLQVSTCRMYFRLLSQTTDGSRGNLKDNHKQFTIDPNTRYRSIPSKIDHERILPLYDTDSNEEFEFLKEKFVKRQYYAREEHRKLLNRFRRGFTKQVSRRIMMPIRVANAFRRQASAPGPPEDASAAAAGEAGNKDLLMPPVTVMQQASVA